MKYVEGAVPHIFEGNDTYRYMLTVSLSDASALKRRRISWIMLNPSQANMKRSDYIVNKVLTISKSHGYDYVEFYNLLPGYSTQPPTVDEPNIAVRDLNARFLGYLTGDIVFAWGNTQLALVEREVLVEAHHGTALCLGRTKVGNPKHPRFVRKGANLENYAV